MRSSVDSRPDIGTGFGLKTWSYLKFHITTSPDTLHQEDICGDTGCSRTLGDRNWVKQHYPSLEIRQRATPLVVRGIGSSVHVSQEYVIMDMYFKGQDAQHRPAMASFRREVTLVDGLQANMLLGMDILGPERIDIMLSLGHALVTSCDNIRIPITQKTRGRKHNSRVFAAVSTTLAPGQSHMLPVDHNIQLHDGQDLLFEPASWNKFTAYAHLADTTMSHIMIHNDSQRPLHVPTRANLGSLSSFDPEFSAFQVIDEGAEELAARKPSSGCILEDSSRGVVPGGAEFISKVTPKENQLTHDTGVIVFHDPDNPEISARICQVLDEFRDIFEDEGFVNVSEDQWMEIQMTRDWEKHIPKKCRPYPLGPAEKVIAQEWLDKLKTKGRIHKTLKPVPFSFPVFVVWRVMPDGTRKGRLVVDIRILNAMALGDAYPMKSQEDMLAKLADKQFITVCDALTFYHQWRIHPNSTWAFTVTTHEGQYTFNCLVMGYKNSNAYVQRQMDHILQPYPNADSYCDDIIAGSRTLDEHIQDLYDVFSVLRRKNIGIGARKTLAGFPNAVVLGRMVDGFGLSTTKERLKAIADLKFPESLKDLETFLGMTGYMRHNVPMYASISEPLEQRKTLLLAQSRARESENGKAPKSRSKTQRKHWAAGVKMLAPTRDEKESFQAIKDALAKHTTLYYFNVDKCLFIDFDVSGYGIGVTVYQITDEALSKIQDKEGNLSTFPPRTVIRPIAFISRTLSDAEKKYWPTEMEIAGFVWSLRKTRHWVDACKTTVYFFTDHRAIIGLKNQTTDIVNTTALSSKNKRLVRAMEYISQFSVEVYHKPGRLHIVPDALSRLPRKTLTTPPDAPGELDVLPGDSEETWQSIDANFAALVSQRDFPTNDPDFYVAMMTEEVRGLRLPSLDPELIPRLNHPEPDIVSPISLIQISPEFRSKIQEGYLQDPTWKSVLDTIKKNSLLGDNKADLPFKIRDGLLWKKSSDDVNGCARLCIPRICGPDIFQILHGPNHVGMDRLQSFLMQYCIPHGRADLRKYLDGCPECRVFRTRRHLKYGNLQPIIGPACPYHTITMDFIVSIPMSKYGNDTVMTTTCKFAKEVMLIPGLSTWTAEQWAVALYRRLMDRNWGIPKVFVSDRDPKFLSAFWTAMWKQLGTKLLYSTAYHPATDGQSERTNQFIESALRYYFDTLVDIADWEDSLPRLQFEFNNTSSAATGKSPNELVMGFTPNSVSSLITSQGFSPDRQLLPSARVEAHDAICIAAMSTKMYYDRKHLPKFFNVGDRVLLRLHKGYIIPKAAIIGRKLGQQYVGPFPVVERIGRSAYRLALPDNWKIHDVISIDHLEPVSFDVFGRYLPYAGPVRVQDHSRRIIGHKTVKTKTGSNDRWLVEYEGLGSEYHEWLSATQLGNESQDLITAFRGRTSVNGQMFRGDIP